MWTHHFYRAARGNLVYVFTMFGWIELAVRRVDGEHLASPPLWARQWKGAARGIHRSLGFLRTDRSIVSALTDGDKPRVGR